MMSVTCMCDKAFVPKSINMCEMPLSCHQDIDAFFKDKIANRHAKTEPGKHTVSFQ